MPVDKINHEKIQKTGILACFGHLLASPFYPKLGTAASMTLTAAALYGLHELGRSKQTDSRFWGFFPSKTKTDDSDVNSAIKNIVDGGAIAYDQIFPPGK